MFWMTAEIFLFDLKKILFGSLADANDLSFATTKKANVAEAFPKGFRKNLRNTILSAPAIHWHWFHRMIYETGRFIR
jgi:hypothetical protein